MSGQVNKKDNTIIFIAFLVMLFTFVILGVGVYTMSNNEKVLTKQVKDLHDIVLEDHARISVIMKYIKKTQDQSKEENK